MNDDALRLRINDKSSQFELRVDGIIAFIKFKLIGNNLFLIHTEVPKELKGKGIGNAIVEKTLVYAKEEGYAIVPICPFVQAYLKRHNEWKEIISKDADRFIRQQNEPHD